MKNGRQILIVEDSLTQAVQLQLLLERHGFSVTRAADGREALDHLGQHRPGLVISDITMSPMDGWELCRRIREDEAFKEIPVILLTALSDPQDILKGLQCGADSFLVKPPAEERLIPQVEFILANRQLRAAQVGTMSLEIFFAGRKHLITPERVQIVNLLFTAFESSIIENRLLERANREMKAIMDTLARQAEELRALSLTDGLTGLTNRRGFLLLAGQALKIARRRGESVVLCLIAADRPSQEREEEAAKEIAGLLRETVHESDVLARLEDGEFAVLTLPGAGENPESLAARLHESLREAGSRNNRAGGPGFHTGTAVWSPESPSTVNELLQEAAREVGRRKESGKDE